MSSPPELTSPISQFYSGRSILVTGSTGFIGKVLIEKLLYSCPSIERIYLLIRAGQGKSPHGRMIEMIGQKPFTLRLKRELIEQKLVAIDSDLSCPDLGLTPEVRAQLCDQVSVVFHVAASVKFDAPLEVNMRHNVVATKELLELAANFKRLACFMHVSTAYSNCQLRQIDERVYKLSLPQDPMTLKVTKSMLENRPNTYTFTKALAENVANQYALSHGMNVVIVRPSIVMSAMQEPTEGWVDTINGPVGLSVLGALGILQKIKVNSEVVFDLIPVDIVSNALVTLGWAATEHKDKFSACQQQQQQQQQQQELLLLSSSSPPQDKDTQQQQKVAAVEDEKQNQQLEGARVFNLTTGSENPCSFYHYFSTGREAAYQKPTSRALRPLLTIPKQKGMNSLQYWIHKVFSHLLFAYLIDFLLGLFQQKRMVVKAVKKMHHANEIFDYFCSNQWTFQTDNVCMMRDLQNSNDRHTFNCDVRTINWDSYAKIGWLGCRRFILKEPDSTITQAKMRYRAVCLLYYATKILFLLAVTSIASTYMGSKAALGLTLIPVYGVIYLL